MLSVDITKENLKKYELELNYTLEQWIKLEKEVRDLSGEI